MKEGRKTKRKALTDRQVEKVAVSLQRLLLKKFQIRLTVGDLKKVVKTAS